MPQQSFLNDLVTKAFDAVVDDSLWTGWFEDVARRMGGTSTLAAILDAERQSILRPVTIWGPAKAYDEYLSGYWRHDPQMPIACAYRGQGIYVDLESRTITDPNMQDYIKWQRSNAAIDNHITAVIPLRQTGERLTLCVHRAPGLDPIAGAMRSAFVAELPAIAHAVRLGFRHHELLQQVFWDGLLATHKGREALLLDEHGKVMRFTAGIGQIAQARDGLAIRQQRLHASCDKTDSALQKALHTAMLLHDPRPGAIRLPRPSGRQPLLFTIYPLQRSARMMAPLEASALVILHSPGEQRADRHDVYRGAFHLTEREVELALVLMQGHSVESAAYALGIGMPTARTHMRRLYEKTGASGHPDLIRILARFD